MTQVDIILLWFRSLNVLGPFGHISMGLWLEWRLIALESGIALMNSKATTDLNVWWWGGGRARGQFRVGKAILRSWWVWDRWKSSLQCVQSHLPNLDYHIWVSISLCGFLGHGLWLLKLWLTDMTSSALTASGRRCQLPGCSHQRKMKGNGGSSKEGMGASVT